MQPRFASLLWNGWYGKPASCLSVLLGDCDHVTWPSPTSPISSVKTNNNPKISNTNNTEYVKSFFSALTKSVQYFQVSAPIWWMVKVPRKNLRRADRHFLYWIFFNFLRLFNKLVGVGNSFYHQQCDRQHVIIIKPEYLVAFTWRAQSIWRFLLVGVAQLLCRAHAVEDDHWYWDYDTEDVLCRKGLVSSIGGQDNAKPMEPIPYSPLVYSFLPSPPFSEPVKVYW